jgi:ParB family chromosome partitioning protein
MSQPVVQIIPIADIDDSVRLRPVNEATTKKLALSMQKETKEGVARRQINPVTVRANKSGGFTLVTGAHRIAAAKLLGWTVVDAIVTEMSDDEAIEAEVDENLYRSDLNGADRALFLAKKLELYTYSGGKLKRGRDLRKSASLADLPGDSANKKEVVRFYDQVDAKFGIKRRTAERLIRRARNISPKLWAVIRSAKKPVPDGLLDKLAELAPEDRAGIERLVVVEGQGLAAAIKTFSRAPTTNVATPEMVAARLAGTWAAWNASDRSRFIKLIKLGSVE